MLIRFCLPLFASVIFQRLYDIADSFVAGEFPGIDALAAIRNSYEITLIYQVEGLSGIKKLSEDFRAASLFENIDKKRTGKPMRFVGLTEPVLVETTRLELVTPCMSSKYSNQLSYASVSLLAITHIL